VKVKLGKTGNGTVAEEQTVWNCK